MPHPTALTVSGKSIGDNCRGDFASDPRVILPFDKPMKSQAGFLHLKGSLFDSAIMKTSVISEAFNQQYLSNPDDPMAFEGPVAVFDGPEDYHHRIETDDSITEKTILIMRGAGPKGYPGAAEVVNMIPPGKMIKKGIEVGSMFTMFLPSSSIFLPSFSVTLHTIWTWLTPSSSRVLGTEGNLARAALHPSSTPPKPPMAECSVSSKTATLSESTSRDVPPTSSSPQKRSRAGRRRWARTSIRRVRPPGRRSSGTTLAS